MLFKFLFFVKIWCVVKNLIQNLTRCAKWYNIKMVQRRTCWKTTTAACKKLFYECVVCVCLTFGTIFLLIAYLMAIGFLMGVLTISFALPINLYKALWISENGLFKKILFQKILNCYQNYHDRPKKSTILIKSNSNLVFLTFSIPSANTDPLVCVDLVFWKELHQCFLYLFLKSLFFAMLGILSTPCFCD